MKRGEARKKRDERLEREAKEKEERRRSREAKETRRGEEERERREEWEQEEGKESEVSNSDQEHSDPNFEPERGGVRERGGEGEAGSSGGRGEVRRRGGEGEVGCASGGGGVDDPEDGFVWAKVPTNLLRRTVKLATNLEMSLTQHELFVKGMYEVCGVDSREVEGSPASAYRFRRAMESDVAEEALEEAVEQIRRRDGRVSYVLQR